MNPKYVLVFESDVLELTQTEVAAVVAMTAQLTNLTNLPGYDPTGVALTLKFDGTGHTARARVRLAEGKPRPGEVPLVSREDILGSKGT